MKPCRLFRPGILKAAGTAALVLALTACSVSLFPEKQPQRQFSLPYHFQADSSSPQAQGGVPVLRIDRPRASGLIGSKRIVLETRPNELAAYGSVRWVTEAPELLRDHLLRALREDPRIGTVVSDDSGAASQITLNSSMLEFQEDRAGDPRRVRLFLQAQLVENGSRAVLATRDFRINIPLQSDATGGSIEDAVTAFGRAADRLSAEVADWVAGVLENY
ncbi:ABC-type transport auxiliary lipoprotein family protein [Marinobacter sp. AN1]|uniref:ABC-type transport auxiliary lipoprotein family protein n=1 Tax=Marinobacter sp. AN1 TaxID=2886046 RepID=UPI002231262E|nr:ABC-type transport auxiliary lipoprotein family protein [Marinobacter sp. AN1]UZD64130.1 ABC-type transport auxiliary lipoprotein family protein [Marinobacter sp. AN1]